MFEDLSKEQLLKIIDVYAKAWQAMDGAYFLALEKKYGIDVAIEMDKEAWKTFSPIEANRIMKEFDIQPNGGQQSFCEPVFQPCISEKRPESQMRGHFFSP